MTQVTRTANDGGKADSAAAFHERMATYTTRGEAVFRKKTNAVLPKITLKKKANLARIIRDAKR